MKKSISAIAFSGMLLATLTFSAFAEEAPVNCETAEQDLAHLQHEKKSTDERKVKGVLSVMPIGLAINAASSVAEHDENKEMDIDEYNKHIDAQIELIKSTCGVE